MKKYILVTLILSMLFFSSCNVGKHEKYASLIADSANDRYSLEPEVEYWTGIYFEKKNMEDKTCHLFGKSYSGSYYLSIVDKYNSYTTDVYYTDDGIRFGLRSDTGELVEINFINSTFFNTQPYLPEVDHPTESAISLATEIAGNFIDNLDDYTQILEEPVTQHKERNGETYSITYYVVKFTKKVKGFISSDFISVKVTSKGTVATICLGDIGAFDDVTLDFDIETVNQSIANKIKNTYENTGFQVKNSSCHNQKIVLTPKGEICISSRYYIDGLDVSNVEIQTAIVILTVVS